MAPPRSSIDLDELVEHWTVLDDERALIDAKHGGTRLGFALLLKFYTRHGQFPTASGELPGAVVEFVARQLQVAPTDVESYEWTGRSIERSCVVEAVRRCFGIVISGSFSMTMASGRAVGRGG